MRRTWGLTASIVAALTIGAVCGDSETAGGGSSEEGSGPTATSDGSVTSMGTGPGTATSSGDASSSMGDGSGSGDGGDTGGGEPYPPGEDYLGECGDPGGRCCQHRDDAVKCLGGGCCVSIMCIGNGEACDAEDIVGQCADGSCGSCGSVGEPCCDWLIPTCTGSGAVCDENGQCVQCGGVGEPCCANGQCHGADLACVPGVDRCDPCGGAGEQCCWKSYQQARGIPPCAQDGCCLGQSCVAEGEDCGCTDEHCSTCGAIGTPCCAGDLCEQGYGYATICGVTNMCEEEPVDDGGLAR